MASVDAFRSSEEYASFMKRWNLNVYFSLRFQVRLILTTSDNFSINCATVCVADGVFDCQDIAGKMDNVLAAPELQVVQPGEKTALALTTSAAASLWSSLHWCLSSEVYVDALAERFIRLILQLLGRFHYWLSAGLKHRERYAAGEKGADGRGENLSFEWALKLTPEQMALLRRDVTILAEHLPGEFSESLRRKLEPLGSQVHISSYVDVVC
jgi:hypothetical protein